MWPRRISREDGVGNANTSVIRTENTTFLCRSLLPFLNPLVILRSLLGKIICPTRARDVFCA